MGAGGGKREKKRGNCCLLCFGRRLRAWVAAAYAKFVEGVLKGTVLTEIQLMGLFSAQFEALGICFVCRGMDVW